MTPKLRAGTIYQAMLIMVEKLKMKTKQLLLKLVDFGSACMWLTRIRSPYDPYDLKTLIIRDPYDLKTILGVVPDYRDRNDLRELQIVASRQK